MAEIKRSRPSRAGAAVFRREKHERSGRGIGASEDAAKMRVNRAVEKLRIFFSKRGIVFDGRDIDGGDFRELRSIRARCVWQKL